MKTVETYIESKQIDFEKHVFFDLLKQMSTLKEIGSFVPELTFWVMTFQDILRINEQRIRDPLLKKIARQHRSEDAGHDKWFLYDVHYMGIEGSDHLAWLYNKKTQAIRDASYAIMSESFNLDDDVLKIVLLLVLESSAHAFFTATVDQLKKIGEDHNLKYFSSHHFDVEMLHTMFEFNQELSESTRVKATAMIDRCYVAFYQMFDALTLSVQKSIEHNSANCPRHDAAFASA